MSRLNRGMLQPVYDRVTSVEQLGGVQINKVEISDTFQGLCSKHMTTTLTVVGE